MEGVEELERVLRSNEPVAVRLNVQGELPTVHDGVRVVSLEPPNVSLVKADGEALCVPIDSIRSPFGDPPRWIGAIGRVIEALSLARWGTDNLDLRSAANRLHVRAAQRRNGTELSAD